MDYLLGTLSVILLGVGALLIWTAPKKVKMQRRNPLKYMKNRMMREGNLSSRQWRKFLKRMKRHG